MRIKTFGRYAIYCCKVYAIAAVLVRQVQGQCAFETAQVIKAKSAVTQTQQGINSLGFKTDADELSEWGNLSAEKTAELKSSAFKAIVSDITAGFSKVLESGNQVSSINGLSVNLKNGYLSIGTAQARGIAARLQKAGLNDIEGQAIQGLVRSLGSTTNKAAKTEVAERIIKGAEKENDSWNIGNDPAVNRNTLQQQAELAATVLSLVGVSAPLIAFENGEAGAQIIVSLGTSAVSYERINQLSNLSEMKLGALRSLTKTLAQQTEALHASDASQQNCLATTKQKAKAGDSGRSALQSQFNAALAQRTALGDAYLKCNQSQHDALVGCHGNSSCVDSHLHDCDAAFAALGKADSALNEANTKLANAEVSVH